MSLRALDAKVVRVLGEWATPPSVRDQGALWRVVEDGRGYPVLQTRILTRDRWVDADPSKEPDALWDGLCRLLVKIAAEKDASAPKVRHTRKRKADEEGIGVGDVIPDVDGVEHTVRQVRLQGPVPVYTGVPIGGKQGGIGGIILTEPLRDHVLRHDDWRAGIGLPISIAAASKLRKRLGVTMVGLVNAKWERATALGGTREEIAARAGATGQAASMRADERRRAKPVPRTPEADAAILAAETSDAVEMLAKAWETSEAAVIDRRGKLRRARGDRVPGAKPKPKPSRGAWNKAHFDRGKGEDGPKTITAFGETKTLNAWTRDARCVVGYLAVERRIAAGWSVEDALTTPRTPHAARFEGISRPNEEKRT